MRRVLALAVSCAAAGAPLLSGCGETRGAAAPPSGLFVDRRAESGVEFAQGHGGKTSLTILETLGNGTALCDFDADGNLDLVLLAPNKVGLYRGNGRFSFTDVTSSAGLRSKGIWHGAATGDFDGDGKVDLYVCGYGSGALYRNLGGLRFQEVTREAGVAVRPAGRGGFPEWRSSAGFVDVDHDGRLDLYVLRYANFGPGAPALCPQGPDKKLLQACDPLTYDSQRGTLYRNLGGGKFADETVKRGLHRAQGHALGIACADYDDDGWVDLAIANDERPGDLFRNLGQGRFEQRGPHSGTAFDARGRVHAGMGIDWNDYDRDGRLDLFVTTFQHEDKSLYRNLGGGAFLDVTQPVGLSRPLYNWVSWGSRFLDYDNDGWSDLMVASGHVLDQVKQVNPDTDYPQPLHLFQNAGGRAFTDVSAKSGPAFQTPLVGRALCTGDIDNDGGLDVVITNNEGQPLLLQNTAPNRGRWLSIRLGGPPGNAQGIGARITLETGRGKRVHDVSTTGSIFCANDVRAHFGLGRDEQVQAISVRWPDGVTQQFGAQTADQQLTLRYQAGGSAGAPR